MKNAEGGLEAVRRSTRSNYAERTQKLTATGMDYEQIIQVV